MKVFQNISELKQLVKEHRRENKTIGFVPTMGALHSGHSKLIETARMESDLVICSIFVNPTQFNNEEDLEKYPRTLEADQELLISLKCDVLFIPKADEIYINVPTLKFNFGELEKLMEGEHRPGHFNGVALIVSKLFHIINPDLAYFGQKDLQQLAIIKQLVKDLSFPVEVRSIPTVRETSGLAKSSRNSRLTKNGLEKASQINSQLLIIEKKILEGSAFKKCRKKVVLALENNGIDVEYLELVDSETLMPIENKKNDISVAVCIAATVEGVRLIDNRIF